MKQKLLLKAMLLLCALVVGSSSVWAVEQVYKTLTFCNAGVDENKTAGYTSSWTETIGKAPNTFSWTITNFNNNNWGWKEGDLYIAKCGRKRTGSSPNYTYTPSVATITTKAAIDEAVTKVVVTLTAIIASDYNSIKLYMASTDAFDEDNDDYFETITLGSIPTSAGNMTITIPEAKRAANRYYKIEFDTKGTTNTNGHTGVTKVEYYYNQASSANLDHIVLGGTYPTEFYVGDTFTHDGLTVTAHYDDASTLDVTSSASFSNPDMSTPGTKTVTVSFEENSVEKSATYDITVSPVPPVVLTLDFTTNIFGLPEGSANKTTAQNTYTYNGYDYTLAGGGTGNGYYFSSYNGENYLMMGKNGSTFTFPAYPFDVKRIKVYGRSGAASGVKFNIFVGSDPICEEATGSDVDHVFDIPSAKQTAGTVYSIKTITTDKNMQITKIELYGDDAAPAYVAASGYSTLATTCGLDFSAATPVGLEAYVASAVSASAVTLTAINEAPASTGVILKGAKNTVYTIPVKSDAAAVGTNYLHAAVTATACAANEVYILQSGQFHLVNAASTIPAGKAYLLANDVPASAPGYLGFDFGSTNISATNFTNDTNNSEVFYNLAGQRVANPTKGLYIVNGRKVVIKY